MKRTMALALITAAAFLTACDGTGPGSAVSLSFATRPAGAPAASLSGFSLAQPQQLVITKAEIVLREIELKRVEVPECDVEPEPEGCEDFETGPVVIDLPLAGGAERHVSISVPAGTYDEVEFDVHKLSGSDPADQALLATREDLVDISIRVEGTFGGGSFVYASDLNEEQKYALSPPLDLTSETSTNVTIRIDVSTWFLDASGAEIDPSTANKGGVNENLVKDNIKNSIDAFEDRDSDGDETDEG